MITVCPISLVHLYTVSSYYENWTRLIGQTIWLFTVLHRVDHRYNWRTVKLSSFAACKLRTQDQHSRTSAKKNILNVYVQKNGIKWFLWHFMIRIFTCINCVSFKIYFVFSYYFCFSRRLFRIVWIVCFSYRGSFSIQPYQRYRLTLIVLG